MSKHLELQQYMYREVLHRLAAAIYNGPKNSHLHALAYTTHSTSLLSNVTRVIQLQMSMTDGKTCGYATKSTIQLARHANSQQKACALLYTHYWLLQGPQRRPQNTTA